MALPFPPTLHLDNQHAWRQGADAVFLPIVYDLPGIKPANPDAIIIQVTPPSLREAKIVGSTMLSFSGTFQETPSDPDPFTPPSAESLNWEEKKKNLALLKRKAETGDFRAPKQGRKDQTEVDPSFSDVDSKTDPPKSKRLSKSVLMLLISVLALVFFGWMAFR